jgi:hypothetical protein
MSRQGRAGGAGKKRKPQAATAARGSRDGKPSKKVRRTNDAYYEALDSDPDEEKHADRYDVSTAAMDCCRLFLKQKLTHCTLFVCFAASGQL